MIMSPLEPFRDSTVIVSGLWSQSAEPPPGVTGADHWVASAFLCAKKPKKTAGADIVNGVTIDQIIARQIGQDTLLPSLQLGVEDPGANSSNCGEGYSCAYTNSISWPAPNRALPMEINPQVVFQRLFGDGSTQEERASRRRQDRAFSTRSRRRWPDSSRSVRPIACASTSISRTCARSNGGSRSPRKRRRPRRRRRCHGVPESFDEHIKLQFDLLTLAFQGDITRVSTLLYARDLTGRSYPRAAPPSASWRIASRRGSEEDRGVRGAQPVSRQDAGLLSSTSCGTRRMATARLRSLARALRQQHGQLEPAPALRRAARADRTGLGASAGRARHLAYPSKTVPTGNLLVSILDMFGVREDAIGDSTGRLTGLA